MAELGETVVDRQFSGRTRVCCCLSPIGEVCQTKKRPRGGAAGSGLPKRANGGSCPRARLFDQREGLDHIGEEATLNSLAASGLSCHRGAQARYAVGEGLGHRRAVGSVRAR